MNKIVQLFGNDTVLNDSAAVSLVCYAEFENTIHIDSERNVIYDYGG